ncbi:MAG: hypothetical protein AAF674_20830 [Pseudomonadota bacterium]
MTTDTIQVVQADIQSATERLVDEYERKARWIAELEGEMREAHAQRQKLGAALEELMGMLEPAEREDLARRVSISDLRISRAMPDRTGPRHGGRPAQDGRRRILLQILLDWPETSISTMALTAELRRRGLDVRSRYAPNTLFHMAKQGAVTQLGGGVYRINRLSEALRASD